MRPIEFRVWHTPTQTMHHVYELNEVDVVRHPGPNATKADWDEAFVNTLPLDECVLMQYVGISDKNGVKIFEGDISRWFSPEGKPLTPEDEITLYQTRFESGCFGTLAINMEGEFTTFHEMGGKMCVEEWVIGNCYQHPDLLKIDFYAPAHKVQDLIDFALIKERKPLTHEEPTA